MDTYITAELTSTPVEGLATEHLDAFSEALFARGDIAGPAPMANLGTGTLSVITCVDTTDVAAGLAIAQRAFLDALSAAGLSAGVGEATGYPGEVGRTELISGADVARRLGVSRQRVYQLMATRGFPRPVATLGTAHVWRTGDIDDWSAVSDRRPGRPRTKSA